MRALHYAIAKMCPHIRKLCPYILVSLLFCESVENKPTGVDANERLFLFHCVADDAGGKIESARKFKSELGSPTFTQPVRRHAGVRGCRRGR